MISLGKTGTSSNRYTIIIIWWFLQRTISRIFIRKQFFFFFSPSTLILSFNNLLRKINVILFNYAEYRLPTNEVWKYISMYKWTTAKLTLIQNWRLKGVILRIYDVDGIVISWRKPSVIINFLRRHTLRCRHRLRTL